MEETRSVAVEAAFRLLKVTYLNGYADSILIFFRGSAIRSHTVLPQHNRGQKV